MVDDSESQIIYEPITIKTYLKTYFCCCIFKKNIEDPVKFEENNIKYRSFFGLFHVTYVLIMLTIVKTIILFSYFLLELLNNTSALGALSITFAFSTICITNILLTAGIKLKRYIFLIPYFAVCVLIIFTLTLQLFVDFLATANTKNMIELAPIAHNTLLLFLIIFEIYMLTVVWKAFVYICDYNMQRQIEKKRSLRESSFDATYYLLKNQEASIL